MNRWPCLLSDLKIAEKENCIGRRWWTSPDALSILGNVAELPLCQCFGSLPKSWDVMRGAQYENSGNGTGHYGNEAVHWIASGIAHYGNPHGSTSHRRMCCRFTAASGKIEEIAALARAAYLTLVMKDNRSTETSGAGRERLTWI